MQGGPTTPPVRTLNCPPWKLHSITSPYSSPSDNDPGPWVQASSVTKNSPSTLKTERNRLPCPTFRVPPAAISAAWHNRIRVGVDGINGLFIDRCFEDIVVLWRRAPTTGCYTRDNHSLTARSTLSRYLPQSSAFGVARCSKENKATC